MTVAVVDSGVDATHPELAGQLAARENFVDGQAYAAEPHGTAVAGIIVAHADNGIGIRGVAPAAHVLALRACSEQGPGGAHCDSFSLGKALNFAILHKPDIINLSLTGPPDRLLQRLVEAALGRGIRVVGAADPQSADGGFPASWPGVVAVTDRGSVGLRAPGRDVPAPLPGARFGVVSGASYAAAQVSGLLALMGELRPGATIARASTAVDACGSLGQLAGGCVCTCPVALSSAPGNGSQAR
jgi:subtilisin family serine protease